MKIAVAPPLPIVIQALRGVKGPGPNGWYTAFCPFHPDQKNPNLRFTADGFQCMTCGEKGSILRLAEKLGVADSRPPSSAANVMYDYVDARGRLLYQVVRKPRKGFSQRRPDGKGGWIWNLKGVERVPYRLPELLSASADQAVFVVEGEKDANRLWSEGLVATTNAQGAGQWRYEYNEHLRGRTVIILPDNDDVGRKHAAAVARSLDGIASEVRVVELPSLAEHGDVSDWFDAGGTAKRLLQIAADTPLLELYTAEHAELPDDQESFRRTDAGNGELFAELYGDRVRYDHRRKRWLIWTGHWWVEDGDGEVRRLAKLAARHRYVRATRTDDLNDREREAKFAIQSENRQRLEAMLSQAQVEHPVSDPGTGWNANSYLLGVANGVVHLRDGSLRSGRPDDRISMRVPLAFDARASCPRWLRFLHEVFRGDLDLIDFIHRAVGYSLTGCTTEQCLFLCHGGGANGKSVMLAVLRALAGDYAYNAPFSLFEIRNRSAIPNDVAALVGRRLVTSSETNEGTRLNEARVKALTGCDSETARFLHGEFFTFEPEAKYWLAVNHKPTVGDDSYGFWRRVRLVPFTRQFDGDQADEGLTDALLAELPGILAWAVQGAQLWHESGLGSPAAVRAATESYRIESDPLAQFISERCVLGDECVAGAADAFKAYKAWCLDQGMGDREMLRSKAFGTRMAAKFERKHTNRGNVYVGVGLLSERNDGEVKGEMKGPESEDREIEVFPLEDRLTRENIEKPFTTLHPSPDEPRCLDGCGRATRRDERCVECAQAKVKKWGQSDAL